MFEGSCLKLGDNVNTDVVMPARYLVSIDPAELAEHVFEPLGKEVQDRVRRTSILVVGRNFGCGSAREQAASGLVGAGIRAVIGESFARTFFRNAINTGLPAISAPDAVAAIADGDEVGFDLRAGQVRHGERVFPFAPFPDSLMRLLDAGGLIPYLASTVLTAGSN